ncbi:MAG: hypothetical protein ABW046_10340 [Actinoplanes sp.]
MATVTIAYRRPSRYADGRLELQTTGGVADGSAARHPLLFAGMATAPGPVAAGLAVLGAVAAADFRHAGGSGLGGPGLGGPETVAGHADPIITSGGGRLRGEALSACSGVHARLDLLPAALDGETYAVGTTSVDLHPGLAAALARTAGSGPLHLSVGPDALAARPASVHENAGERTLHLSERWLTALTGAASTAAALSPLADLDAATAAALLHRLAAHGGRDVRWLLPAGRSLRTAAGPSAGAICLAGAIRLAVLRPVLPMLRGLRLYGPPAVPGSAALPTGWELDLGPVRLSLLFSPGLDRAVADGPHQPHTLVAGHHGLKVQHERAYDWAEDVWYRRDLPYRTHPRSFRHESGPA